MKTTEKAPNVPIASFKRTKILATIGPASNTYDEILEIIKSGANGIRLNFSHGSNDERVKQIKWIRKASKEYGKPVAIVQDLQGPKIRLGDCDGIITVRKGQQLTFKYNPKEDEAQYIPTQFDLSKKVKRGERMMLFDGKVLTTITSVKDGLVHAKAENDGILLSRKGINLPDTDFAGDVITQKDKEDLAFGSEHDVDYVAMSFIQSAADVRAMKRAMRNLNSKAKLIAKVETQAALDDIEAIVKEADAVMVARGDLAVEASPEVVPIQARKIVGLCRAHAKPVIIATQMLVSMTEATEPTRAEVSDVATASIIGADCVMLSEETAAGKHPSLVVKTMKKILTYTESHQDVLSVEYHVRSGLRELTRQEAISKSVVELAKATNATAIVAETKSGATAREIAAKRPDEPIIAVTSVPRVSQQLCIVYGIKSYVRPDSKMAATKLTSWLEKSKVLKKGDCIVTASGQYPGVVGTTDTIKVRVI